ncbi:hypothetical protein A7U60_g3126 [Sanghuangporus baumii]|uniref:DNA-binding protein RAP1 n=1 Tax=Sanghuangporus baumii TaxID=108892 RepID=A0A9Q5I107_SANBA|nr:hypothetical protein A7U60_g3126 [Sanghuangporus baumii]
MSDSDTDEVNHQVFTKPDDGKPVKFFIHQTLTLEQQTVLERDILANGGVLCAEEKLADTILAHHEVFHALKQRYAYSKTIYVELPDFVRRCLKQSKYVHDIPQKRSLGGRPVGIRAKPFTHEEDLKLARYLANMIPYREAGGRTGNRVYEQLCNPLFKEDYPWAANHPWQSWRNRYRSKQDLFDAWIDDVISLHPPHPDGKGEYPHDRRLVGLTRRRHRPIRTGREEEESDGENSHESDAAEAATPVPRRTRVRTANERDEPFAPHRDGKRRKVDGPDVEPTPSPEQARKAQHHSQTVHVAGPGANVRDDLLSSPELISFNDDGNYVDVYDDDYPTRGPINTQATLVGDRPQYVGTRKPGHPVEVTPSSLTLTTERRMAARNKERSAIARPGATGRTVLPESPSKSTQATFVATQRGGVANQDQTRLERRSDDHDHAEVTVASASTRPSGRDATRKQASEPTARRPVRGMQSTAPPVAPPDSPIVETQARTATIDAPYRNTRARSRSVEPMPPPAIRPKLKGKAVMQTTEELAEEDDYVMGGMATNDEQQSLDVVEDALRIVQSEEYARQEVEQEQSGDLESEEGSQNEEDEEDERESQSTEDIALLERGNDIRQFIIAESTPHQSRSFRSSFGPSRLELSSVQTRVKGIPRHRAESSEGEFPAPGTRSKEARNLQEQIEKAVPFTPTPGTRAERVKATQQTGDAEIPVLRARARKTARP